MVNVPHSTADALARIVSDTMSATEDRWLLATTIAELDGSPHPIYSSMTSELDYGFDPLDDE